MAKFLTLRQKEKDYIFKVFDNEKSTDPARAVFYRFPLQDESFPYASQKLVMESAAVKEYDNTQESKQKLVEQIINTLVDNIHSNLFDYTRFLKETIDHFENFEYDNKQIKTVDDFLTLPQEAVQKIAKDLYFYSKTEDEFSMLEKKI
jgi:hypothetical protein